jgi:ABC-2 type transport system ATP-binding protein
MLEARNLSKAYRGAPALVDLSLTVGAGEIFCLLGANGAGKSTTIKLFLDFVQPDAGAALVDGLAVAEHPLETKKRLAYIPENVMLYGMLDAYENLDYFCRLGGVPGRSGRDFDALFDRVGLARDAARRRVGGYSKGMRQKVGIAIALAREARALLLDEPTSGLDPQASAEFSAAIRSLRDDGAAILMATHDLFRAREDASRIGIMKQGRLVETLTPADMGHADIERIYLRHMHA